MTLAIVWRNPNPPDPPSKNITQARTALFTVYRGGKAA